MGDKGRLPQSIRSSAGEISRLKGLDRDIPVTEVWSLATFAIVLALFGSENLAKLAAKKEGQKVSSLAKLTALIVHSSLIQIFALIIAFSLKQKGLCSQPWRPCGWQGIISDLREGFNPWNLFYRVGFFLTLYGLILVISTLLAIFQTSQITR